MYVIYDRETTVTIRDKYGFTRLFNTERGARAFLTKLINRSIAINGKIRRETHAVAELGIFHRNIEKMVTERNLMSGKLFTQPVNTPLCCDPSSETYWSM